MRHGSLLLIPIRYRMKIVLALGNPGDRYAETRHNIGWIVADAVASRLAAEFRPGKGDYYEARLEWKGHAAVLVKPTTYMNNSGIAARQVLERYGVEPAAMLAIVDEIQFPVGRIQVKPSGSSGGHNGTESLIYHLDSIEFPRLRCGVGRDFGPGEMVEYVLGRFPKEQEEIVAKMVADARDTVLAWIAGDTEAAMKEANRSAQEPGNERRREEQPPGPTTRQQKEQ